MFASTLTIWHKDVNESWNTLFDLINSEKYRLDAQHLTNKTMSENQYLLAQISVLENYMEHYIQKHHENPVFIKIIFKLGSRTFFFRFKTLFLKYINYSPIIENCVLQPNT